MTINNIGLAVDNSGSFTVNNVELAGYISQAGDITAATLTGPHLSAPNTDWVIATSADGNYVLAAAQAPSITVLVSSDGGINYTSVVGLPSITWVSACISESGQYQLLVKPDTGGGNAAVFASSNYGTSFGPAMSGLSGIFVFSSCAMSADGSKMYVAVDGSGVYVSTTFGSSWTATSATSTSYKIIATDSTGQRVLASNGATLLLNSNGLTTGFTPVSSTPTTSTWKNIAMSYSGDKMMGTRDLSSDLWYSTDSGVTWSQKTGKAYYGASIGDTPAVFYATVPNDGIYGSTDNGATWSLVTATSGAIPWVAISASKTNNTVAIVNYNIGLYLLVLPPSTPVYAKTFVVDHPLDPARYLVHACLEGPEAGVYYRGRGEIRAGEASTRIELPLYTHALATDFTVQITPIYSGTGIGTGYAATEVESCSFTVYGSPGRFYWHVYGRREVIDVEPLRAAVTMQGDGPYRWLLR